MILNMISKLSGSIVHRWIFAPSSGLSLISFNLNRVLITLSDLTDLFWHRCLDQCHRWKRSENYVWWRSTYGRHIIIAIAIADMADIEPKVAILSFVLSQTLYTFYIQLISTDFKNKKFLGLRIFERISNNWWLTFGPLCG